MNYSIKAEAMKDKIKKENFLVFDFKLPKNYTREKEKK